ncbi:hypothetical protein SAMN02799624_06607 [Paenibacillus sp. UNC496MF]|uniref:hypothetical protein n=1 Tax=Paenibacillus sp. UNC496MF TaxID=1502753 RepID=UPI0008E4174C|nr:hypothetical protein [Paenibacillus sp. UNC496MF]SFJ92257.1 hypothetical protein SAMN02799624_06607 [Paenibacillus sp. UNC496MF]
MLEPFDSARHSAYAALALRLTAGHEHLSRQIEALCALGIRAASEADPDEALALLPRLREESTGFTRVLAAHVRRAENELPPALARYYKRAPGNPPVPGWRPERNGNSVCTM